MGVCAVLTTDEEGTNDCSSNTDSSQDQGEDSAFSLESNNAQSDGGNQSTDIGLEQVSTHTGNVTNVVTNVVADNSGVAGVILGDAGLNLTNQVSADVSSLGIDTAANTGKQSDGRSTEAEAGENVEVAGNSVDNAYAEKAETNNAHTHDGTAGECDVESLGHAAFRSSSSGTNVSLGSNGHANVACSNGEECTCKEADSSHPVDAKADSYKENCDEVHENLVLSEKESTSTFLNGSGNFLHLFIAGTCLAYDTGLICSKKKCAYCQYRSSPNEVFHLSIPFF